MTTADDIHFENEPEMPAEMQEHLLKAVAHHLGHGEHPGMYTGPQMLAAEKFRETSSQPPADQPKGPLPPQEAVQLPEQQKKGRPPAQQHGQTPTATGAAAVQPQEPEGNF